MVLVEYRPLYAGHVRQHGLHAGRPVNAALFVDDGATGERVAIVSLNSGVACTVLDYDDYARVGSNTWSLAPIGYVFNTHATPPYLHIQVLGRTGTADTVDHVNRIKTDNRRRNLRLADQSLQNSNRQERSDRMPVHPTLQSLGVDAMPRYVRYDAGCERFTFIDSPVLALAGVAAGTGNGTRCSSCSLPGKYLDCLRKYVEVHGDAQALGLQAHGGGRDVAQARALIDEYAAYAAFAHSRAPEVFPPPPSAVDLRDRYVDDVALASQQVAMLEAAGVDVIAGAANIPAATVAVVGATAQEGGGGGEGGEEDIAQFGPAPKGVAARVKGNRTTLFDAGFERGLSDVNWDVSDSTPRVHMSAALLQRWPQLAGARKRWLGEVVWVGLAGRGDIPRGSVLVPLNWEHYDVRLDNLILMPGDSGKNYKRPDALDVPVGARAALGMRFLPRGITLSADPPRGQLVLVQLPGGGPKKRISVAQRFTFLDALRRAVEDLRGQAPDTFDAMNERYQRLMREWRSAQQNVAQRVTTAH